MIPNHPQKTNLYLTQIIVVGYLCVFIESKIDVYYSRLFLVQMYSIDPYEPIFIHAKVRFLFHRRRSRISPSYNCVICQLIFSVIMFKNFKLIMTIFRILIFDI